MTKKFVFTFWPQMVVSADTIEEAWEAARNLTVEGLTVSWPSVASPTGIKTMPLGVLPVHAKEMEVDDGGQVREAPGEGETVAGCVTEGDGVPDGG